MVIEPAAADRAAPPFSPHRSRFDRTTETPRLWDLGDEPGVYRRREVVRVLDDTWARGELEDDFHHFRVDLHHDGATVLDADGSGIRGPWSTCMDAGTPLREIEGLAVTTHPTALATVDSNGSIPTRNSESVEFSLPLSSFRCPCTKPTTMWPPPRVMAT